MNKEQVKVFVGSSAAGNRFSNAESNVNKWLSDMHPSIDITRVLQDADDGIFIITIFYRERGGEALRP